MPGVMMIHPILTREIALTLLEKHEFTSAEQEQPFHGTPINYQRFQRRNDNTKVTLRRFGATFVSAIIRDGSVEVGIADNTDDFERLISQRRST